MGSMKIFISICSTYIGTFLKGYINQTSQILSFTEGPISTGFRLILLCHFGNLFVFEWLDVLASTFQNKIIVSSRTNWIVERYKQYRSFFKDYNHPFNNVWYSIKFRDRVEDRWFDFSLDSSKRFKGISIEHAEKEKRS